MTGESGILSELTVKFLQEKLQIKMKEKIGKAQYLIITAVLSLVLIFNFLSWQSPVIGTAFGLAYVVFYSFIFRISCICCCKSVF